MSEHPVTVTHPAYAILAGALHRQDEPGGDWTMLDGRETAHLLVLLSGIPAPAFHPVKIDPGGCAPAVIVDGEFRAVTS